MKKTKQKCTIASLKAKLDERNNTIAKNNCTIAKNNSTIERLIIKQMEISEKYIESKRADAEKLTVVEKKLDEYEQRFMYQRDIEDDEAREELKEELKEELEEEMKAEMIKVVH